MELLFRQVDLTNNKKIIDETFVEPFDVEVAISSFETLKQENIENKTFKEWTSQCFEYNNGEINVLVYYMFFV